MSGLLQIDGASGGGQILRSSLSLAAASGRGFEVRRIRAHRPKPGLRPQHLVCVQASAEVCSATTSGAGVGSEELRFEPGSIRGGRFEYEIPTAGSVSLVAQTLIPPLLLARTQSEVAVSGGTHVEWAPPFEYLERIYGAALRAMGAEVSFKLLRHGFFPRGGGRIAFTIRPARLTGHDTEQLCVRDLRRPQDSRIRLSVEAVTAGLPEHVGRRMIESARKRLSGLRADCSVKRLPGGPGAYLFVHLSDALNEWVGAGFVAYGRRGLPAERLGESAAAEAIGFVDSGADVDVHLADQLLVPAACLGRSMRFRCPRISDHLRSNASVVEAFGLARIRIEPPGDVTIECAS